MQTFEAILSLLFFMIVASSMLAAHEGQRYEDDSLYRLQLAEDAWRVLYLHGDFENLSESKREAIERHMQQIGQQTSLCIFLDGTKFTNCRGGDEAHEMTVSLRKTVLYDGVPKSMAFSIGK